jgi:hypothetical protein
MEQKEPPPVDERPATWAGSNAFATSSVSGAIRTKPSWATKRTTTVDSSASEIQRGVTLSTNTKTGRGPRTIVFVVGGMTWSEVRTCHELASKYEKEILVGSTHILSPAGMFDLLRDLHRHSPIQKSTNPFNTELPAMALESLQSVQNSRSHNPFHSHSQIREKSPPSQTSQATTGSRAMDGTGRNVSPGISYRPPPSIPARRQLPYSPRDNYSGGSPVFASRQHSLTSDLNAEMKNPGGRSESLPSLEAATSRMQIKPNQRSPSAQIPERKQSVESSSNKTDQKAWWSRRK